jgi:hypothetical protein
MVSVSLSARLRERKVRKLARLLVSLDDTARAERHQPPRKTVATSLSWR